MKSKKALLEQSDDIMFSAFMALVAKDEGERLIRENNHLETDSSAAISKETYQRVLKSLHHCLFLRDRRRVAHLSSRAFRIIAVAVCILVLLTTAALALFPSLRAYVSNMYLQEHENFTSAAFLPEDSQEGLAPQVGWVPEGFICIQQKDFKTSNVEIWGTADGKTIEFEKAIQGVTSISTSGSTHSTISIRDNSILVDVYAWDKRSVLSWFDMEHHYILKTEGLDLDTEIRIAENFH